MKGINTLKGATIFNANGDVDTSGLGFQIAIDTLTYIKKQVTEQKFYEEPLADFVPIAVGEGAFSASILTNLSFNTTDDFEAGNIGTGVSGGKLAQADAAIASKSQKVINWAKEIGYTIFDIEQALTANNWDLIAQKHASRKKNWDLGIQEIVFLGSKSDGDVKGLLTNEDITIDTTTLPAAISSLDATAFQDFVKAFMPLLYSNSDSTVLANRFCLPKSDLLGLVNAASPNFPNISKIEYMENAFKKIVPDFKIVASAYSEAARFYAKRGTNKNRYVAYRFDPETIRMDIPVDYTSTQPNSSNNFSFNDVAYGQYTGVTVFRNLEALYIDVTPEA